MAESAEHRKLIVWLTKYVQENYSFKKVLSDLQERPGEERPPRVGEPPFEPDLFAQDLESQSVVLGEAKTDKDATSAHSEEQFKSFINYLEGKKTGLLIIALPGYSAQATRYKLQDICMELEVSTTKIQLWDSLDIWCLTRHEERLYRWHCK